MKFDLAVKQVLFTLLKLLAERRNELEAELEKENAGVTKIAEEP